MAKGLNVILLLKCRFLAQMRSADRVEQCLLSGATEKIFAHPKFFSV
jgi:hypothetical protein